MAIPVCQPYKAECLIKRSVDGGSITIDLRERIADGKYAAFAIVL